MLRLYDAHNHLQDERLSPVRESVLRDLVVQNVAGIVVNGSGEDDWSDVLSLALKYPMVLPSFGVHPWYVKEQSSSWYTTLVRCLDAVPSAIGEVGLDRWVKNHDLPLQEKFFQAQLKLASERNLPVSIHCLQAWGRLLELLHNGPVPRCGFLLHSFGGPREMISSLAELGAYFSLPGYFAHPRKDKQREAFRHVPPDRLLIETDAPDQLLPTERADYQLRDERSGRDLNHPANIGAVYRFAAELIGEPLEAISSRVEQNFFRLFSGVLEARRQ